MLELLQAWMDAPWSGIGKWAALIMVSGWMVLVMGLVLWAAIREPDLSLDRSRSGCSRRRRIGGGRV